MAPLPPRDRMFSILVLGGIGLVTPACGGGVASPAVVHECDPLDCPEPGADASTDAFPAETGEGIDGGRGFDAFPSETGQESDGGQGFDAFPSETAQELDGGLGGDGGFDGAQGFDAFPTEGPVPPDAAPPPQDATIDAFPEETAVALDGGTP